MNLRKIDDLGVYPAEKRLQAGALIFAGQARENQRCFKNRRRADQDDAGFVYFGLQALMPRLLLENRDNR